MSRKKQELVKLYTLKRKKEKMEKELTKDSHLITGHLEIKTSKIDNIDFHKRMYGSFESNTK